MEIKFIGQGLDTTSDSTTGNFVIDSLESNNYTSFNAFVALVSKSGLKNIMDEVLSFRDRGGEMKLFLGVNLHATSKEALEELLERGIETYVVYAPNSIIYHPKIYSFEGETMKRTIIGSSNLTASGLFQNIEASVCVDFASDDDKGNEFLADVYDHFNSIVNLEHPSCQKLTQEVLNVLVESKVVMTEEAAREKNNKINKEFGKRDRTADEQLNDLFGKLKKRDRQRVLRKTLLTRKSQRLREVRM